MPLRPASLLMALGFVLITVAGCAGSGPEPPAPPPPPEPVSTPPPAPLPPAANGNDPQACAEGSCEVRVDGPATIPLNPRFGVTSMRVEAIGADKVTFVIAVAPGSPNDRVTYSSNCAVRTTAGTQATPASVTGECTAGGRLTVKTISVGVAVIRQNAAIIRLLPL